MTKSSISNKWSEVHFKNSIFEAAHLCVWLQTEWHLVLQLKGMLIKMCHCPKTQKAVNAVMVQWIINSGITSLYAKVSDFLHCSFLFFFFLFINLFIPITGHKSSTGQMKKTVQETCVEDRFSDTFMLLHLLLYWPPMKAVNSFMSLLYCKNSP